MQEVLTEVAEELETLPACTHADLEYLGSGGSASFQQCRDCGAAVVAQGGREWSLEPTAEPRDTTEDGEQTNESQGRALYKYAKEGGEGTSLRLSLQKAVRGKRARVAGLGFAAALLVSFVLVAPPTFQAADPGLGEVERVEARSVAPLEGVKGFVFVSVFDAMKGAKILGGWVEGTEGFYQDVHTTQVWYGGALIKFHYGVECGQEVTVTFHVVFVPPGGAPQEFVKSATYYC